MHKCDVCRRRDAVYLRTYSGHKLCLPCLEKILARTVKRAIGESHLLEPRPKILVPIRPSAPAHSLAILALLSRVEKKFDATLGVLLPSQLRGREEVSRGIEYAGKNVKVEVIEANTPLPSTSDAVACIRFERAWSLHYARKWGADAVAFPVSRTCMNLIGVEALLSGRIEALSESLPILDWARPPVLASAYYIEAEALTAYAYLRGLHSSPLCNLYIPAKTPLLSIMGRRPELEFSSHKTIMRIAERLRGMERCRVCGGFTREGSICRYCEETGASQLFLSS